MSVVAPAGYGKTTLLSQWAERNGQAFAWVHNPECRAAMPVLAGHVPDGSQLVLAGRDAPPLPIARLRAEGRVMEIGPGDLALTLAEAASLLREAGITLGQDDMAELHRRTEGWPAGLYLAALSLREGGSVRNPVVSFTGEHQLVSRYMESEFLARLSSRQRVFLTRTAVLEQLCGPLCEEVLGQPGAAAILADLARSNVLLVALDRRGEWYRYHHLFRDMLLAELHLLEPDLIPVLRRRAAVGAWRTACPRKRWSIPSQPAMLMQPPDSWRAWQCLRTGKAGLPPWKGGSAGWTTRAGSRDTRWSRCWPRFCRR